MSSDEVHQLSSSRPHGELVEPRGRGAMPDTIVALSSGALPSGVAVIRLSGPATRTDPRGDGRRPARAAAANSLDHPQRRRHPRPGPRRLVPGAAQLHRRRLRRAPGSRLPGCGSRHPPVRNSANRASASREAGEFTRRAFENGKLDLTEVEGLGDLIAAETESQRKQAAARLAGGVADQVHGWREQHARSPRRDRSASRLLRREATSGRCRPALARASVRSGANWMRAIESVARGRIVREGLRVALAGPPNAGKSSLLNALARPTWRS